MEPRRYHHGDLRPALLEAGLALAREGGPDAVVLREAARRTGVSHNAVYRHYPDRAALLAEVRAHCMAALAREMEAGIAAVGAGSDAERAVRRLEAVGRAYVEFALAEPGWFRTAFSPHGPADAAVAAGVGESGLGPYELLAQQLDGLVSAGAMPPERRPDAEVTAWSAVHGIASLLLAGPLQALPAEARERPLAALLETVARGLTAG